MKEVCTKQQQLLDNKADDSSKNFQIEMVRDHPKRAMWDNKIQYLMGVTSFAVGLGNVWRFPYLCQQHGGGAFLIPYVILLFIGGLPISLIEMGIGQSLKQGPIGVWKTIHPYLGGLGICSVIMCFLVGLYYNMSELPWSSCPKLNGTVIEECEKSSSTAYYWYRTATDISSSINETGNMKWWLVVALIGSWILVYICIMRGIKSSGKLDRLQDPRVWMDAATQVFFSLGLALGTLIAFSSYNPDHNDCVKDSVITTMINLFTSIYTSIVVFAILGFKALNNFRLCESRYSLRGENLLNETVKHCNLQEELDQVAEGTGLVFIVFTEAILALPGAPFWSIIFFLMLLMLGLGSQFGIVEGVITNVFDAFHSKKIRKEILSAIVCLISCLFGLIFTTRSGQYWVDLLNSFGGTTGFTLIAFLEIIGTVYIYGYQNFANDLENMTGRKISRLWSLFWKYVSPLFIAVIFTSSLIMIIINMPKYFAWNKHEGIMQLVDFPMWATVLGFSIVIINIMPLPLFFFMKLTQKKLNRNISFNVPMMKAPTFINGHT